MRLSRRSTTPPVTDATPQAPSLEEATLPITGMTCANCVATVEKALRRTPGVDEGRVNYASERAFLRFDPAVTSLAAVAEAVKRAGYGAIVAAEEELEAVEAEVRAREERAHVRAFLVGVVLTVPLFVLSMARDFALLGPWAHDPWVNWLMFALATPVQFYVGRSFYRGAWNALRNRAANMDVLVALGSTVAYGYSVALVLADLAGVVGLGDHVYFETAALIITLIKLGKLLEARAKGRTGSAIRELLDLQPATARRVDGDREVDVPLDQVVVGDLLLVRPGERVPVDGTLVDGAGTIDESMLTGESIPIERTSGDPVFGGTVNRSGAFRMETTAVGKDTALGRVVRLVREAQGSRAPIQAAADRVAEIFVPVVVAIAVVTFAVWWLLPGASFTDAMLRLIAVLVIACPCALGLATPTAVVAGMGWGARRGVLFRNSAAMERTQDVHTVILDKTGTITRGEPTVRTVHTLVGDRSTALMWAASAERRSEHPLAQAIVAEATVAELPLRDPTFFESIAGYGVDVSVEGAQVLVGNRALVAARAEGAELSLADQVAGAFEEEGLTPVYVARSGSVLAVFGIADEPKPGSAAAVAALQRAGADVVMVTGDREGVARSIGREVGIDEIHSEVRPGRKAGIVQELQELRGRGVAMVGDGINDAPALARADVGIAIGTGTDVAIEAADVILMSGELDGVSDALELSRRTMRTIRQNLFWAFAYNVALIPVAAGVFAGVEALPPLLRSMHPVLAAAAMALSSISVVTNSLRLTRGV